MRMFRWTVVGRRARRERAARTAISGSADNIARLEQARTADPKSEAAAAVSRHRLLQGDTTSLQRGARPRSPSGVDGPEGRRRRALSRAHRRGAERSSCRAKTAYESYLAVGKTRGVKNQINARLAVIDRKVNEEQRQAGDRAGAAAVGRRRVRRTTVAVMPFTFTGATRRSSLWSAASPISSRRI